MIDLQFDRVSKKYRIRREVQDVASQGRLARLGEFRKRQRDFWALKDMSFKVARGETLGIIGPNGAGKSTVLKLLSKITAPTSGEITILGKLSALIEVGSGFHPELTGRENVYLSGSILGMRRREIAEKLNSIIEFSGVSEFIDVPVKRYSSGMYVRLGFSIAAHLQPDILLLDEVLAVGDAEFQSKCLQRISELKATGTTIVFISHDLNAVEFLCDRVLLLQHGEIVADGLPRDVIRQYGQGTNGTLQASSASEVMAESSDVVRVTGLTFHDYEGNEISQARTTFPLLARVEFLVNQPVRDVSFEVYYYSQDGKLHCQYSTSFDEDQIDLKPGKGAIEFLCDELGLQPGLYYADVSIKRRADKEELVWGYRCALLRVNPGKILSGRFYTPHRWRLVPATGAFSTAPGYRDGDRDHPRIIDDRANNSEGWFS
jgi:ABC-type polysaccharide/polyol phosphate transport system ATPase subunit